MLLRARLALLTGRLWRPGTAANAIGRGWRKSAQIAELAILLTRNRLHDTAGSTSSTTEGDECVSTHRRWWCHASLTAGGDRSSRRCRGCDGASRHGQTHSSCPRATTRLITAERRVDTVELTRLSLASALPALAGGSARSMTRWKSARRAKRKRNDRGRELRDIESTASCRGRQTRGGAALRGRSTPKQLPG